MKPNALSRRRFLHTDGAGALAAGLPVEARLKAAEDTVVGVSKWELDTPALCVDLDKLDQNIAGMKAKLAGTGVATRPHAKTHKCPAIAKLQLAAGSIGVCAAKVSEAEALFANGVDKILMTTSNVSASKIRRAMKIRKANLNFIQAVDYAPNARDLNDAAKEAGIVADVVIGLQMYFGPSPVTRTSRGVLRIHSIRWR